MKFEIELQKTMYNIGSDGLWIKPSIKWLIKI